MKKNYTSIFFLITFFSFAQEFDTSFNFFLRNNSDVFETEDKDSNNINLFLSDRKKITSFLLDENLNLKDSLSSTRPKKKYKEVIGNSGNLHKQSIYWSVEDKKNIYIQTFDYKKRIVKDTLIEKLFSEEIERFLQAFSVNKKFYILTINSESFLKIYEFYGNEYKVFGVDLSKSEFINPNNTKLSLYDVFPRSLGSVKAFEDGYVLKPIENNSFVPLSESSIPRKIFFHKNEIFVTLDVNNNSTNIIKIDLETKFTTVFDIEKPKVANKKFDKIESNSFIINEKIFQVVTTEKELNLSCKKFDGTILREYSINENEDFMIKNTPFIRESKIDSERELEKTSQFLRKIVRYNFGLSVSYTKSNYIITLGCISDEKPNWNQSALPISMENLNGYSSLFNINSITRSYNEFLQRKSIYTLCLFDEEMNHLSNKIEEFAFDKIEEFEKKYGLDIEAKIVFKNGDNYILGYYNPIKRIYCFKKFTD